VADYNAVYKDKCLTDFMRLKDCYLVSVLYFMHFLSSFFWWRGVSARGGGSSGADVVRRLRRKSGDLMEICTPTPFGGLGCFCWDAVGSDLSSEGMSI